MKQKFELYGSGKEAYLVRMTKNHWWSRWKPEMDGNEVKKYPVDQKNCKHNLVFKSFATTAQWPYGVSLPLYKCDKCGYEQIGKNECISK